MFYIVTWALKEHAYIKLDSSIGALWCIKVYYGVLWYIMVYYGILWYIMGYYGVL